MPFVVEAARYHDVSGSATAHFKFVLTNTDLAFFHPSHPRGSKINAIVYLVTDGDIYRQDFDGSRHEAREIERSCNVVWSLLTV